MLLLEQIVEATGAKIVLSSTRHYFRWQKDITCYKMYFCLEDELYGVTMKLIILVFLFLLCIN